MPNNDVEHTPSHEIYIYIYYENDGNLPNESHKTNRRSEQEHQKPVDSWLSIMRLLWTPLEVECQVQQWVKWSSLPLNRIPARLISTSRNSTHPYTWYNSITALIAKRDLNVSAYTSLGNNAQQQWVENDLWKKWNKVAAAKLNPNPNALGTRCIFNQGLPRHIGEDIQ